ncbi:MULTISPECIES: beta strand repeat-containing protein [unclassified Bradyrhizobium]|uniref:beta strand repeat-containing protein n=1 Tax=unclassified Bradyrhizobium TaxID=2631580 RepID=UPI002FEED0B3
MYASGGGADFVGDFNRGQGDRIDLTGMAGIYSLADVQSRASQQGPNTLIDFGNGDSITLANIAVGSLVAGDFVFAANGAPTDIALSNTSVAENSAFGAVVGALSAVDPDGGDTATFTLLDDAGGRFAIEGGNLVVAGALDYESATSHQVTVRVTDSANNTYDETFTIAVTDVAGVTLSGDDNANTLVGTAEADTLNGLGGNDRLQGLGDNDALDGGTGFDRAVYRDASGGITANLAAGTVSGAGIGSDTLTGVEGIIGSDFADTFNAASFTGSTGVAGIVTGQNEFEGRGGDDLIIGSVNALGQAVTRTSYLSATSAVTVDLAAGTADGDASVGHDTLLNVNSIVGSSYNDTFYGSNNANFTYETYEGRGGDDYIDGRGGSDQVNYQNDPDTTSGITVHLAAGTVTGDATVGTDTIRNVEAARGTNFDDVFDATGYGLAGALNVSTTNGNFNDFGGLGGNDTIIGNGNTRLNYQGAAGSVLVDLETSAGTAITVAGSATGATEGTDSFTGVNAAQGSMFGDTLRGSSFSNTFTGLGGDDFIDGRGGFDTASYNSLSTVTSGVNVNLAAGTATGDASIGIDTLRNIEGVQGTMLADSFNATGYGLGGALNVSTSNGNFNQFEGLGGDDAITGNGNTRLVYTNATAGVTVDIATGTATGDASVGTDTFTGVNSVNGSAFADTMLGTANGESFLGLAGNDTIDGRGGFDAAQYNGFNTTGGVSIDLASGVVTGDVSVGADTLLSIESVQGTNFADTFVATGFGASSANGGSNDTFNTFQGLGGNDTITGNGSTQLQYGSATGAVNVNLSTGIATGDASVGTDTITGGVNNVFGSNFGDTIIGSSANDFLHGGNAGNDTLSGGIGNDNLTGGIGADTFVYASGGGADFVGDFNRGQGDRIDVTGVSGIYSLADIQAHVTQQGPNTLIDFGNGDSITLANIAVGSLVASDFVFAANGAPTDIALSGTSVAENSAANTIVGSLSAVDPDGGDTATFTLLDDAGGRFAIEGGNLVVAGALDYESATSHQVTVRVTDSANNTFDETFTIAVTDVAGVTLSGDDNANTLVGTAEADTLNGLGGNDRLQGLGDNDALDGGTGFDRAIYSDATGGIAANLAAGTVTGAGVGSDTLTNVEGIIGSDFADTFDAAGFAVDIGVPGTPAGFNEFQGRGGDDIIVGAVNGYGAALTRVSYVEATSGVTVDLAVGTADGDASVGHDTFVGSGILAVWGSAFNDSIYGGDNAFGTIEVFDGRAGNDLINGRGGFDRADYTDAAGSIVANMVAGTVTGDASAGTDTLISVEAVRGTNSDDTYNASGYSNGSFGTFNEFTGNGGNDTIVGNGNTRLSFNNATGAVTVDLAGGFASGDASVGNDTFTGVNAVQGSMFADTLSGSGGNETFTGIGGDDFIDGRGGFDTASYNNIYLSNGGISVSLAAGTVTGNASIGTDTLRNIEGVQGTMLADSFNATGYGLAGALNVSTSNGTFNQFEGLGGDDAITGNGSTRVLYNNATAGVTVTIGAGGAGSASGDGSVGTDSFSGGVNSAIGSNFADSYNASAFNNGFNSFQGNGGNDTITGNGATQVQYGNATSGVTITIGAGGAGSASSDGSVGIDTFTGGVNNAIGGNFADSYDASGFIGFNSFQGQGGNDTITGNGSTQIFYGSVTGAVNVNLATGIVTGNASVGTDTITGGVNNVFGSNFDDALIGGSGADFLHGGNGGNDTLSGGIGNDNLTGGTGSDTFVYASGGGADFVVDFNRGQGDRIDVTGVSGIYSLADIQSRATQQGPNTLIDFGNGDSITLANVAVGSLVASDFIFAANGAPTDIGLSATSVAENSAANTVVGSLSAVDPDAGDTASFTLVDNANGLFAINGGNLVVAGALDYETATSHQITVRVTDSANHSYDKIFTIDVTDVAGLTVNGDGNANTLVGTAEADTLNGLGGNDRLRGLADNDLLDGGTGFDRAIYTDATGAITVNLAAGTVSGAGVGNDTLTNVEGIVGSDFADTFNAAGFVGLTGLPGVAAGTSEFEGRGGDDLVIGAINAQGQVLTRVAYLGATGAVTVDIAAGTADGDASVGHDTISNISTVWGSAFNDTLRGSDNAFATFETYEGRGGDDYIDGRGGYDQVTYNNDPTTTSGITVQLAAGTVTGDATVGTDTIRNVEAARGTNFDDVFDATGFGGAGALNVGSSGTFNDFAGAGGNDTVIGNGNTRLNYSLAAASVTVDLETSVIGTTNAITVVGIASGATEGTDSLTGVNAVQGSTFADTLLGSSFNNTFIGLGGDDYIDGRGGFDTASYNSLGLATAGVSVNFAAGTVIGDASIGTDTLRSIEAVQGTNFADSFNATGFGLAGALNVSTSSGNFNQFEGLAGNDSITGNGNTRLMYTNATAGVTVDLAAGTATGDASVGTDTFTGVNSATGSAFADVLSGSGNGENFTGLAGNDVIDGRGGFDTAIYNGFNTTGGVNIDMASGTVTGDASVGTDTLLSIESIQGTNFDDIYVATGYGTSGTNVGDNGTFNQFQGLAGNDTISGNGNTQIQFNNATGGVNVNLATGIVTGDASVGTDTITGGVNNVFGSSFGDILVGSSANDILNGGNGGNDILNGGGGADNLSGGIGADTFVYGSGGGSDFVSDFNRGQGDRIDVTGVSGIYSLADIQSRATQQGPNTLIDFGNGDTITLANVAVGSLVASDFIFAANGAPTDIGLSATSVAENSAANTVVGSLSAVDPDAGDTASFTLVDNANGLFAINGGNLVVAGALDYETATSHQITVRVTDSANHSYDKIFTIDVTDVAGLTVNGDGNANTLVGTAEADTLNGLGGTDRLQGLAGNDQLNGGLGFDRAIYTDATGAITVNLAAGTVSGAGVGNDTLNSVEGAVGSDFADTFNATGFTGVNGNPGSTIGFNEFEGGGGDDVVIGGINGQGQALTRVSYLSATAAVTVDIAAGTADGDASVGHDTISNVNAIWGSYLNDTLRGSNNAFATYELFEGRGGEDFIDGRGGYDQVTYNSDTATTSGITALLAAGTVTGDATVGTDTIRGVEAVRGTSFDDVFDATGFGGADALNVGSSGTFNDFAGGGGNDTVIGNGFTRLNYSNSIGAVTADLETSAIGTTTAITVVGTATAAGEGTDSLTGVNAVQGSVFADTLLGSSFNNTFTGLGGDDYIDGRGNFDTASYNSLGLATAGVNVNLAAGIASGDASIGTDTLRSIEGVQGTNFADTFDATGYGLAGALNVSTSSGNFNQFEGLGGDDTITGNGNTQVAFFNATGNVSVDLQAGSATGDASVGHDTFIGVNSVIGSIFNDTYVATGFTGTSAAGSFGTFNQFKGQGGDDTITGNGNTRIVFSNATGGVTVDLATGNVNGNASVGHDTITGGVNGVFGSNFGDTLTGSSGNDFLNGNGGNDTINGGGGADNLFGGVGADTFVYATGGGSDFVGDFNRGQGDRIDLTGMAGIYSLADVQSRASQQGSNTLIDFGNGDTITLANIAVGSLVASDFVFAANGAPTDIALSNTSVAENSAAGTVVGALSDVDPDTGDTAVYTLLDDAGGLFAIEGGNLVVAGALDYESATSHQVTVRVTDSANNTYDETFTIAVTDVAGVTLNGDGNTNTLVGTAEADTLNGLGGNDRLQGLGDNDALDGGTGFDRAIYSDATGGITANLAAGTVTGAGVGSDTLTGVEGVIGSNFADTFNAAGFTGSTGQPGVAAGQTDFEGLGGDDVIIGYINALGQSVTRINYLSATGAVTVDIAAGTADGDASVGHDTFSNVATVWGSASNDTIYGSNNGNFTYETFEGRVGDDYIDGRGGYDSVTYNNDPAITSGIVVHLAAGTVNGDASVGTDTIRNVEAARGTNFNDVFDATGYGLAGALNVSTTNGNFNDFGGAGGNDTIIGNGNTRLNYQVAAASVTVDLETSAGTAITVAGSATGATEGTDTFTGVNAAQGSMFGDTLRGSSFSNTFTGLGGDDFIDGRGGFDTASYNSLSTVTSGVNVNLAAGTATGDASIGADTLRNIEGVQGTMLADSFNATGYGLGGALNVSTSNGNFNQFEGLGGDDAITGNGSTRVLYNNATAGVTITLGAGGSGSAQGTAAGDTATVGTDSFGGGVNSAIGSNFADSYNASGFNNGFNSFQGNGGNDTITGNGATQVQYGNATSGVTIAIGAGGAGSAAGDGSVGTDTFTGGVNSAVGGNLADSYDATGFVGFNSFQGQGGNDTITGNGSTQVQYGSATSGVNVNLATGIATGDGSVGTDTIIGGVNNVFGSNFGDTITGSSGNDFLNGNGGNDTINGGGGNDNLNGGAGNDNFVFAAYSTAGATLTDFAGNGGAAGDTLEFHGFGLAADGATFTFLSGNQWQVHSGLDGHDEIITLNGSIHASDYQFLN